MKQMNKAVTVVVLIFHILLCMYESMLCLYACSSFVNNLIWNTDWLWDTFFYPDETMALYIVPLWLLGVIASFIIIAVMIRNRNAVYTVPLFVTFAVTLFLSFAVLWAPMDRFPLIVHDLICWTATAWYLFDIIFVLWYFTKKQKNNVNQVTVRNR